VPTPLTAVPTALALAVVMAALTPALLRWCPVPDDAHDLPPFAQLGTRPFRWAVFAVAAVAGSVAFALTEPRYWAAWAALAGIGALLGLVDLRTTYLPLRLNYLGIGLGLAGAGVAGWLERSWQPVVWAAASGLVATGFFWLVWRFSGDRLGFGDVRLAGLIGVVAGMHGLSLLVWAFLLGSVTGAIWGAVAWLRRGRDGEFPYGPALLLGPLLALALRQALRLG
jgi:leader peptidase (prepilin peptidase)/N-methyltransferase